jgi:hypothetical protein
METIKSNFLGIMLLGLDFSLIVHNLFLLVNFK